MKTRLLSAFVVAVALAATAVAQDAGSPPLAGQNSVRVPAREMAEATASAAAAAAAWV